MKNSKANMTEAEIKPLDLGSLEETAQLPPVRAPSRPPGDNRDLKQAKNEIDRLKHANQSLRECWAQTKWHTEEQKHESQRRLAELLY